MNPFEFRDVFRVKHSMLRALVEDTQGTFKLGVVNQVKRNFQLQQTSTGTKWKRRKRKYRHPLLRKTHAMYEDAIHVEKIVSNGAVAYQIDMSDLSYPWVHLTGVSHWPRRHFLPPPVDHISELNSWRPHVVLHKRIRSVLAGKGVRIGSSFIMQRAIRKEALRGARVGMFYSRKINL